MEDHRTKAPDVDYFFLGDGRIVAAIQWSRNPTMSPYGIVLRDAERLTRKEGSWLFHPEFGLSRSMLTAVVDGRRYRATHDDLQAAWALSPRPCVILRWKAGPLELTERLYVQESTSNLLRDVSISSTAPHDVELEVPLYANPLLFDEFGSREEGGLYAEGYGSLRLYSAPTGRAFERFLTVACRSNETAIAATFIYSIEAVGTHDQLLYPSGYEEYRSPIHDPASDLGGSFQAALTHHDGNATAPSFAARIEELYEISHCCLRASVSRLGKFDASIWQYTFEWGLDAAMAAIAATCAGDFPLARQILRNLLTRLSNDEGMIAESSRCRGGEMSELNGNGATLDAVWHYYRWSNDDSILRAHWRRIVAIADYLLRPEFQHESGLIQSCRDFWERFPWMGVQPGFDLGHQTFAVVGLRRIAEIAQRLGHVAEADRWRAAGDRIHHAMLHHARFSMIHEDRFIFRRLLDGSIQQTLVPRTDYWDSAYAPYIPASVDDPTPQPCEPDSSSVLPIIYGLVDPQASTALNTLNHLSPLWNTNGIGGYARYNIASDPDSPGPWAFPTAFIAAAECEAGLTERAHASITWLMDMAGTGGSWFEYYGERQTPPYAPIGIIVWGWAQFILLVVKHVLGVRIVADTLRITPKLVGIDHTIRIGTRLVRINVRGLNAAELDGHPLPLDGRTAELPLPLGADHTVEFIT